MCIYQQVSQIDCLQAATICSISGSLHSTNPCNNEYDNSM